jgi:hypothetical protein
VKKIIKESLFKNRRNNLYPLLLSIGTIALLFELADIIFDYDIINRNFEIASILGLGLYVGFYFIWLRVLDDFIYPALSESDEA